MHHISDVLGVVMWIYFYQWLIECISEYDGYPFHNCLIYTSFPEFWFPFSICWLNGNDTSIFWMEEAQDEKKLARFTVESWPTEHASLLHILNGVENEKNHFYCDKPVNYQNFYVNISSIICHLLIKMCFNFSPVEFVDSTYLWQSA